MAASSGPFPDAVSSPGTEVIQITPLWAGSVSIELHYGRFPISPSSSTRGGGSGQTAPEPRGSAAIVGGLVETFASGGVAPPREPLLQEAVAERPP